MNDELVCRLELACSELLEVERLEATLRELFASTPPGTWANLDDVQTRDSCHGISFTWLQLPEPDADFVLVVFLHAESGWTMTAAYNKGRLFR